jgi:hypothetical protein
MSMKTVEIAPKNWEQFCDKVQEIFQGTLVNIQLAPRDGAPRMVARDLPLLRVTFDDKSDRCNNNLVIEAGLPGERTVGHVVVEPIHIRLKDEGGGDRYHRLQIIAENGTTEVEFHPGLKPGQLEALEEIGS